MPLPKLMAAAAAAGLLAAASPAAANVVKLELDLTTGGYGAGAWAYVADQAPGTKFLGAYSTGVYDSAAGDYTVPPEPPLGQTFTGDFTVDTSLWTPSSYNNGGVVDFNMTIGGDTWTEDDILWPASGFQNGTLNNMMRFGLYLQNAKGDILSLGWRTKSSPVDTIDNFWMALDETFPGACIISTDLSFSGYCIGSVNKDVVIRLAPEQPGGGDGGGIISAPVPEPATWALMIVGCGATGAMLRRRRAGQGAASA